jgi:hypothetical protein
MNAQNETPNCNLLDQESMIGSKKESGVVSPETIEETEDNLRRL